jgi:hypothetical protein
MDGGPTIQPITYGSTRFAATPLAEDPFRSAEDVAFK